MDERTARNVVLVRAIETTDGARETWSDADRVSANRAAAEIVGEAASDDAFLGHRARFVVERLAKRHPKVQSLSRVPSARGWLAPATAIAAFVIGAAGVDIGPARRINLLAPPVLALLAWNVAVYVALAASVLPRGDRSRPDTHGPLRRSIVTWLRDVPRAIAKPALPRALTAALARFASDWSILASPLWQYRAALLLHVGAATLAAGAIAGLYLRGIALEFRAGWQSTFLDATDVARLLHVVLAPGSWLTGIAVPGADHLQTIAGDSAGENAAPWIHLYAATLLAIVIIPRLALAAFAAFRERRLALRFPLALDTAYFQRLLHAWREGTARVMALPYSYAVPRANAEGLVQLLTRVFQSTVEVGWLPAVPYGGDDLPAIPSTPLAAVVVVFNLSATPERENQAAFLRALATHLAGGAPLVAIVDTSEFGNRFQGNPSRIAERRLSWQQTLAAQGIEALFVRLAEPNLAEAAEALATHFEHATQ